METPSVKETRWEKIESDVEELFHASDLALFALYNRIMEDRDGEV